MIRARAIEVRYQRGGALAVSGVNLDLRAGAGLLITGDRGSGKSSVLRAVLGLAGPGGDITVLGSPAGDPAALRRIGWAPQAWPFTFGLRGREVVRMVAELGGHGAEAADRAIEQMAVDAPDARVESLEMEDVRRICMACAIIGNPDLLVIDDPWEFPETTDAIRRAMARGAAVLAASSDPGGLPGLLGASIHLVEGVPG
ncbi:MAG: ATP-binding cassette domain-containing protein [Acidobacteria bacterium]|nr:ATP-binding cassette domain-containing protein [Acidobacteriota bacterium]